ncbi:MAG: hypothetical protein NUK63_10540 [Candidatus Bathyarchaeum tardum]|nr:MAG: hypothetical protein NUK63_10540 [Candidatus Bathyarchaeum tardum]
MTLVFVLSLLVFSTPLVHINAVYGINSHVIWVPNNETGYEPDYEESYSCDVCDVIHYSIVNYGNFDGYGIFYNQTVTQPFYLYVTGFCESTYDYCAVFSKGHDTPWGDCGEHYELKAHNGAGITDADISDETGTDYDFVFLWHCGTAHEYPSSVCYLGGCSGYGEYKGHCYAWTHDNSLATDGYSETTDTGAEVFLGFINASDNFKNPTNYDGNDYGCFAATFYYYLLNYDYSVKTALNSASVATLGCLFSNSTLYNGKNVTVPPFPDPFWSRLAIYGNGDLSLP